ncbi:hypothetical protein V8F33_009253 [Rhypophila sp. PSN 637]
MTDLFNTDASPQVYIIAPTYNGGLTTYMAQSAPLRYPAATDRIRDAISQIFQEVKDGDEPFDIPIKIRRYSPLTRSEEQIRQGIEPRADRNYETYKGKVSCAVPGGSAAMRTSLATGLVRGPTDRRKAVGSLGRPISARGSRRTGRGHMPNALWMSRVGLRCMRDTWVGTASKKDRRNQQGGRDYGPVYSSSYWVKFGDHATHLSIEGLTGCTAVIVVSKKGALVFRLPELNLFVKVNFGMGQRGERVLGSNQFGGVVAEHFGGILNFRNKDTKFRGVITDVVNRQGDKVRDNQDIFNDEFDPVVFVVAPTVPAPEQPAGQDPLAPEKLQLKYPEQTQRIVDKLEDAFNTDHLGKIIPRESPIGVDVVHYTPYEGDGDKADNAYERAEGKALVIYNPGAPLPVQCQVPNYGVWVEGFPRHMAGWTPNLVTGDQLIPAFLLPNPIWQPGDGGNGNPGAAGGAGDPGAAGGVRRGLLDAPACTIANMPSIGSWASEASATISVPSTIFSMTWPTATAQPSVTQFTATDLDGTVKVCTDYSIIMQTSVTCFGSTVVYQPSSGICNLHINETIGMHVNGSASTATMMYRADVELYDGAGELARTGHSKDGGFGDEPEPDWQPYETDINVAGVGSLPYDLQIVFSNGSLSQDYHYKYFEPLGDGAMPGGDTFGITIWCGIWPPSYETWQVLVGTSHNDTSVLPHCKMVALEAEADKTWLIAYRANSQGYTPGHSHIMPMVCYIFGRYENRGWGKVNGYKGISKQEQEKTRE